MTTAATMEQFASAAARQLAWSSRRPLAYLVGAMLAGAFVCAASILSLSVGAHLEPGLRPLAMGGVFGISVVLVIFAGAELFNGQVMFTSFALLRGEMRWLHAGRLTAMTLGGNLLGAALLCGLFRLGGGGQVFATPLLHDMIIAKTHSPIVALIARGAMCNWLACMGIWTAGRMKSEGARMAVLAWCVAAYVACGLEHAIADMAYVCLGLLAPAPIGDLGGFAMVAVVSLGNALGGGVMVAGAYTLYATGAVTTAEESAPAVERKTHAQLIEDLETRLAA